VRAVADDDRSGPLAGLTVIEMAGLGPAPFAALILAEMGARVVRIERAGKPPLPPMPPRFDLGRHGREILTVDLKQADGAALVLRLAERADVLVEGFRPGVMERLGLGPEKALAANPRLVYARMTGFGQDGPLAGLAGHDLSYLAWTGVLHAIGEKGRKPVPPLNLVADYGGGAMFLIAGVLAALFERQRSGKGQVVDAAMVDGVSMLSAPTYAFMAAGVWQDRRGDNLFDGGAPFYDAYETADGGHVAVACLEPQFFAEFARLLPLDTALASRQYDRSGWDDMRSAIAARMRERSRDEWTDIFAGSDACVAPVLSFAEAAAHPHNRARKVHLDAGEFERPAPAPRFSRSASRLAKAPEGDAPDAAAILAGFGLTEAETQDLAASGAIAD
jgi:alpha-methylacyl-CoA racemase